MWYSCDLESPFAPGDEASLLKAEFDERYDWLSSVDDGHGDVQGVGKASEDDSSELEDNEPFRGSESDDDDEIVKWLKDGREVLVVGSQTYWNEEEDEGSSVDDFPLINFKLTGRNLGCSFLGFCAFELNESNNSASWTVTGGVYWCERKKRWISLFGWISLWRDLRSLYFHLRPSDYPVVLWSMSFQ